MCEAAPDAGLVLAKKIDFKASFARGCNLVSQLNVVETSIRIQFANQLFHFNATMTCAQMCALVACYGR